ncbi:MAG TPA: AAA family ATPase, partial [Candidatus Thermoplasmatota archaeon]
MRLNRLRLVNYRRFADAQVEFPDGLIGIVGRNGSGKSSMLESVLWALFGHDAARTNKELVKRQAAAPGEDVVVRVEFEIEGIQHAVTRRLRGRSLQPEAAVESSEVLVVAPGPNSWEQANLLIMRILGFDRSSFESTVVAKQGELAALSELRPAQRKKVLLGLLGIDRIDQAVQQARADGRILDARLGEARRSLADEDALRAELKTTDDELTLAKTALAKAESEADAARRRLVGVQHLADDLLARKIKDQELRIRLQALQSRLESIWGQRTRL